MQYMSVKEAAAQWDVTIQMVRRYCQKGMVPQVVQENGGWRIPVGTPRPGTQKPEVVETKQSSLVTQIKYQCKKNNHFGIYEYIQVNLAYSSSRMASNRLTREQVMEVYRTGKISVAFEPMKIDDLVEISNHFRAGQYMVDTIADPITTVWLRKLHHKLFRGTKADQEGTLHIGTYRSTPDKFGVDAATIPVALSALITEYESKKVITLRDILDFHARFEQVHPFEDGNGRVGRMLMVKECLRHGIDPFIIDDKHRGAYNRGIGSWKTNPKTLTEVAEQAQARFQNQKETLALMEYCRPPAGRGAR